MDQSSPRKTPERRGLLFPVASVLVFAMALTGFGQMPIYKRYYLADIPGMTWLADFYITRYIHYVGAIFLLALLAYIAMDHMLSRKRPRRITRLGIFGTILMTGLVTTGIFFTIKNLSGVFFSAGVVHLINLGHLGFAVLFLGFFIFTLIFGIRWVKTE